MRLEALIPLYGGYTLSRNNGVIFIRGALPGEVVEAEVVEKKRDYSVASVKEVLEPSSDRVLPPCPVFGGCGGCHYQYIAYRRQVSMKEEVVLDCIRRIGKLDLSLDGSLLSEPWHYRKRAQFKVSADGRIGFYRALSHDVVEIDECLLLAPEINTFLRRIRSNRPPAGIREIHVHCGDVLLVLVKGGPLDRDGVARWLRDAGASGVSFEDGTVVGAERLCLDMNGYYYLVSAKTFFQGNWNLNRRLLSLVASFTENVRPDRVIDLYSGAGNFAIPLSPFVKQIVAVEGNPCCVRDGLENLDLNRIGNVKFVNKDVEGFRARKPADLVVLDPPRTGLPASVRKWILDMSPEWLVYVSCNPSTFARDLNHLKARYSVESVRMVDMFPQTYHIEILGILKALEG